ncbi:unnamed protein product, partial [Amoebophrya sp. A25]
FTSRIEVHSGPEGLTQSLSDEDGDDDDLALAAGGRPTDGGARAQLLSTVATILEKLQEDSQQVDRTGGSARTSGKGKKTSSSGRLQFMALAVYAGDWGHQGVLELFEMAAAICRDIYNNASSSEPEEESNAQCKKRLESMMNRTTNDLLSHYGDKIKGEIATAFVENFRPTLLLNMQQLEQQRREETLSDSDKSSGTGTAGGGSDPLSSGSSTSSITNVVGPLFGYDDSYSLAQALTTIEGGAESLEKAEAVYVVIDEAQNLSEMALLWYVEVAQKYPAVRLIFAFDRAQQVGTSGLNDKGLFIKSLVSNHPTFNGGRLPLGQEPETRTHDSHLGDRIQEIKLTEVWRSPPDVLELANAVLEKRDLLLRGTTSKTETLVAAGEDCASG